MGCGLKLPLCFVLLIIFVNNVYGLSCQYTDNESYSIIEERYFFGNMYIPGNINITEISYPNEMTAAFKVFNSFSFDVNITINYTQNNHWYGGGETYVMGVAKSNQYSELRGYYYQGDSLGQSSMSDIKLFITYPLIEKRIEPVYYNRTICKKCLDKDCLNNGDTCTKKEECGSNFCIRNVCSPDNNCYNNDCKCAANEISCNNKTCVAKWAIPIDSKPSCNNDFECTTNYTNETTGRCAKSPSQLQEEENQHRIEEKAKEERRIKEELEKAEKEKYLIIVIILCSLGLIIISIIFIPLAKAKYERDKTNRIHSEIKKVYALSNTLIKEKQELEELDKIITQKKKKNEDTAKEDAQYEKLLQNIKDKEEEITKPHYSYTRGFMEWCNPRKRFYPCFWNGEGKNNDIEVHKYFAEKEIFNFYPEWFKKQYPGKVFEDLEVHHIDKDKFNYDLANLVIMSKEQHRPWEQEERIHAHIQHKNWGSGIEELKKHNIKAPHIEELGGEIETDPYIILGLKKGASQEEIKTAFKMLSKQNHPDLVDHMDKAFKALAEKRFKRIKQAYNSLKK